MISNNQKIAKNAIFLYIRMLFAMVVNLYASRLLLSTLGIEDYGIYNIVGGIVAIMMFVNTAMQSSTIRFITFSIGKKNKEETKAVINASIHIHLWIMLLILFVGETIGLWFISTQINIPESSRNAAMWVYQFSLFTSGIAIVQVPFNAIVVSYERMDIYALIEIANVILRCVILFIVPFFCIRLFGYAILLTIVAIIVFFSYAIFCKRKIDTFHFKRTYEKKSVKPMINFAAWNLYGNGTYAISQQGTNILINKFFGVTLNAASGVATQASSILAVFVTNVQSAFNPQIIKEFSADNIDRMKELILRECEIMLFMVAIIFTPLCLNMDYIMTIWLKEVPQYAVIFCQLLLVANIIQILTNVLAVAIQATGRNRLFSFIIGTINLLSVVFVGICFLLGADAYYAYIVYSIALIFKLLAEALLVNKYEPFLKVFYILKRTAMPIFLTFTSMLLTYYISKGLPTPFLKLVLSLLINTLIITLFIFTFYPTYKTLIINYVRKKISYGKS